jgi:glyoxylase-like metal-dependent hydrolase (beta-lactamase superfamily II)
VRPTLARILGFRQSCSDEIPESPPARAAGAATIGPMAEDYSGPVEPGGPALTRTVDTDGARVEVRKLSVGPMDNNVYLLRDAAANEALLVDAANDAGRILEEIAGIDVVGIVTTHGHWDHWQALDAVREATGAPAYVHPADAQMVEAETNRDLEDRGELVFGDARVRLVHTPGHTHGSTCLLLGGTHLFTGDTLFPGGPGRVTTPVEFDQIMNSLEQGLFTLPDETWVYPGHGDDTTIGAERPSIPEWRARGW